MRTLTLFDFNLVFLENRIAFVLCPHLHFINESNALDVEPFFFKYELNGALFKF